MRRIVALWVLLLVALIALPVGGAAAQATPSDTTTATTPVAVEGGTSPWVLVLIGAAAGTVVGAFTGLARRRRRERESSR
jgi:hypothetical protein